MLLAAQNFVPRSSELSVMLICRPFLPIYLDHLVTQVDRRQI